MYSCYTLIGPYKKEKFFRKTPIVFSHSSEGLKKNLNTTASFFEIDIKLFLQSNNHENKAKLECLQ